MDRPSGLDEPIVISKCSAQTISSTTLVSSSFSLSSSSAFADHMLGKICDHPRRSCAGTAVHRNLLHPHAAHTLYPLLDLLGSPGQGCLFEDLLINQTARGTQVFMRASLTP